VVAQPAVCPAADLRRNSVIAEASVRLGRDTLAVGDPGYLVGVGADHDDG
jgi:hypothetical protein